MRDNIELFLGLNKLHWQDSAFQWLFYAAIVLTLIFEKRKLVRIVFGWVPALLMVFMFNPLCVKLLNIAGLFNEAYFARLFSFMPLMYVIAKGFMFLTSIRKPWLKLACLLLECTVICLVGQNIYHESWFTKAENIEKVPTETLDILEKIKTQGEHPVSIAAIGDSRIYLRQVDDVIMPYGRKMGELGKLLSERSVDVKRIMELAGQQDVDYIMVHRTRKVISSFLRYRYQPFALTKAYAVYMVEGVPRIRRKLNEKKQVVSATYYNKEGEPDDIVKGYAVVEYDYDSMGNKIRESYLDKEGNLVSLHGGYSTILTARYANGNIKKVAYLDQSGNPIIIEGSYERRYKYNISNQVTQVSYYNLDGKPMKNQNTMFAICKYYTRNHGSISGEQYLDENGNPTLSSSGYAKIEKEYDNGNRIKNICYFDTNDNKIVGIGFDEPKKPILMDSCCHCSEGGTKNADGGLLFKTDTANNRFNAVRFQIYDANSGQYLSKFGDAFGSGSVKGEYQHQLDSGVYKLVFKANSNLDDESITSFEYLEKGETLYYSYFVDELSDRSIVVSNFYIGRYKEKIE